MLQCLSKITELRASGVSFVCVTLVATRGYAPQDVGARILVGEQGLLFGTVGGGKVEAKAIKESQEILAKARGPELLVWNLQRDVGMSCGGEVSLFFEPIVQEQWEIAVFGAGHVAQKLVPLLLTLPCRVTCLDPRPEWLEKLTPHPNLKVVCSDSLPDEAEKLPLSAYIMLMTQGHAFDLPILTRVLKTRNPPYLGVIGSPVKSIRLRKELAEAGIESDKIERFHCPMGNWVGSNEPAEIALSMAAQVLQLRDQMRGASSSLDNAKR